ncbi:FxsA family protein [Geodermatophilus sp. DSM 44513]|uniref:FxsA family protein n=1 Tax=Geodermatophilus sp. DSM 44513 TaxID=1528104 RepID=UPI00127B35D0|nr:FxsA family protein [Geodermatophilus sp. DSM 44513]WNV77745.1 FxsA family protein [Geodermatophilus sp. DSM 44513]
MGHRVRVLAALWVVAEVVVFVLVASWIGVGWTLLAALATTALGWTLLARQGTRALAELRERARERRAPGRALGDAGLIAAGGLLMVLPGFVGDVVGLLCLLPPTRFLVRALLVRAVTSRLPVELRGPVRVRSARAEGAGYSGRPSGSGSHASGLGRPLVIEGEVLREGPVRDDRVG